MKKVTAMLTTVMFVCMSFVNSFAAISDYYPPHDSVNDSRTMHNMPQPVEIETIEAKKLIAEHNFDDGSESTATLQFSGIVGDGAIFADGALKIVKTSDDDSTHTQVKFKYSGKLDENAHYAFSCRIKCEGLVNQNGGPRNLLEAYETKENEADKWLSHSFVYDGHKYESGDTDWYTVCQMLQLPENADYFVLSAYVNENTTGTIYFDDFKLYKFAVDPFETVLLSPSYKGLIFEDGTADISIDVLLEESSFYSFGNMSLELKLVDNYDNIMRYAFADILSSKMNFTFSSDGLSEGVYYLQIILKDVRTGEQISVKEHTIRRTDTYPETYLNEKGNLVRNGETKFFKKIMNYYDKTEPHTITQVAEKVALAGIDSVSNYSMWWADSSYDSSLEYLRQIDSKMHLCLAGYWWSNYGEQSNMFEGFVEKQEDILPFLTNIANDYKDDDILDGYYLFDEPYPIYEGEEIRWNNEILAETDINHPTYGIADKDYDHYGIYTKMSDILGVDPYPVYGRETDDIAKVGRVVRQAKKNFPNRPLYLVLQCFNWGVEQNDDTMRGPNYTELRNMAWQGICEGAVGLDAFAYPAMVNDTAKSFDQWWSDLSRVYEEVELYGDAIISEEPSPMYTVSGGGDWLNILVKRFEGKTYIFAVNNTKLSNVASINITGAPAQTLDFEPLEVKIVTVEHEDYLSPEAQLFSFEVSNGEESFPIIDGNGKKIIFLPEGIETINYASNVSDGSKLYINGVERERCGTINIDNTKFTVTVVAQNGINSTSESYDIYTAIDFGAYAYKSQDYVAVVGNAGRERAFKNITLMLVSKDADFENLTKSDIGYITQTKTDRDGSYAFEFGFSDFTYDSEGNVDNYMIILNAGGVRISETVSDAKVTSKLITFDLDMSQDNKIVANMVNSFGLEDLGYTMLIGFYDDKQLLDIKQFNKYVDEQNSVTYNPDDIPDGTTHIKGFLWDTAESLIPLASSKTKQLKSSGEQNSQIE